MRTLLKPLSGGLFLVAACTWSPSTPVGEGQACDANGQCATGYVCHPVTRTCVDATNCADTDGDGSTPEVCGGNDCDDANPNCTTDCTDSDSDGWCVGHDCDDLEGLCTADCTTDVDSDTTVDCLDTCVDEDGDGLGTGINGNSSCPHSATDTNDGNASICGDTDADGCEDCLNGSWAPNDDGLDADTDDICDLSDGCVDADRDNVGTGVNGNVDCATPENDNDDGEIQVCIDTDMDDCDDCSEGNGWAPGDDGTDSDGDGICNRRDNDNNDATVCFDTDMDGCDDCSAGGGWDPANDGTDTDGDGWCDVKDCADTFPTCTNDCSTDVDGDQVADCADTCLDQDVDGAGIPGPAGDNCTSTDCKDNDNRCTTDCTACAPAHLILTPQAPSNLCDTSTITIDLDMLAGAASQLTCSASDVSLRGPVHVENDGFTTTWGDFSASGVELVDAGDYGFSSWCGRGSAAVILQANVTARYLQTGAPLDLTGWENIRVAFVAGYARGPSAGEDLQVLYCCGPSCTPTTEAGEAPNAASGGRDECWSYEIALPSDADGCNELEIRFEYQSGSGHALLGEMEILADLILAPITESSPGTYESSASSCEAITVSVTCEWPDGGKPVVSDTQQIEW